MNQSLPVIDMSDWDAAAQAHQVGAAARGVGFF
jgi:hypothetical protein